MKMKYKKINNLIFSAAIIILGLVVLFSGFMLIKPMVSYKNPETSTKTIERDGKKYFPRQDITVFLIMGIDREGVVEDSGFSRNDGDADVVVLAVFDETDKSYDLVCLNRDTMVEMPVFDIRGKAAGSEIHQLALSYTYGSGLSDSCENTQTTVSDFLYGLEIDYYLSMNMDVVGILNDAVGGVIVNVTDDFSAVDPTITKGELKLNSEQALNYVRTRKDLGDQMNVSRMKRHEEFMSGFFKAFGERIKESDTFALSLYEDIADYSVTNCTANTMVSLANRYSEYTLDEIVSPEGENVVGKEYMEFHVDEEKLDQLIIRMFYQEKKK